MIGELQLRSRPRTVQQEEAALQLVQSNGKREIRTEGYGKTQLGAASDQTKVRSFTSSLFVQGRMSNDGSSSASSSPFTILCLLYLLLDGFSSSYRQGHRLPGLDVNGRAKFHIYRCHGGGPAQQRFAFSPQISFTLLPNLSRADVI